MLTIKDVREIFKGVFGNNPTPLEPIRIFGTDRLLGFMDSNKEYVIASSDDCRQNYLYLSYHAEMPTLIENIPVILKTVIDQDNEIVRHKETISKMYRQMVEKDKEIARLKSLSKYPNIQLGVTVYHKDGLYTVVGGDVSGQTHLIGISDNGEKIDVYCDWSECEVVE